MSLNTSVVTRCGGEGEKGKDPPPWLLPPHHKKKKKKAGITTRLLAPLLNIIRLFAWAFVILIETVVFNIVRIGNVLIHFELPPYIK
jgi:hypothetical protein